VGIETAGGGFDPLLDFVNHTERNITTLLAETLEQLRHGLEMRPPPAKRQPRMQRRRHGSRADSR
jgi:hypothetical protein